MEDKMIFKLQANICKSLGHPVRIEIIDLLRNKKMSFGELGLATAGVFAHYQAEAVAHNIARKIAGKKPTEYFRETDNVFWNWAMGKQDLREGIFLVPPFRLLK